MQSDYFVSLLYYAKSLDKFLIIDTEAEPARGDHVITKKRDKHLVGEAFKGQRHFGVVRWLVFYEFKHSEQSLLTTTLKKPRNPFPRDLAC